MDLTNNPNTTEKPPKVLVQSRKHPIAYVLPVLLLFIIFQLFLSDTFFGVWLFFFALPTTIWCILRIVDLRSYAWTLTKEELIIQAGYLPWRKSCYEIPLEDIYEAYSQQSMLGAMLGYGEINIRRTEGNTTAFCYTTMSRHKEITSTINGLVRPIKKARVWGHATEPIPAKTNSLADELTQMLALKEQGVITAEEFQALKANLINGRR